MGFFRGLFGQKEAKSVQFDENFLAYMGVQAPSSGVVVNWRTAIDVSTVFACVRVLANGISQVPLRVMQRDIGTGSSHIAFSHPLNKILYRKPNQWQSSYAFRETMMLHLGLTGDFFAFKNLVRGEIKELIPIDPGCVTVTRNKDYSLTYQISTEETGSITLGPKDIWHVRGPSWDGYRGLDAVAHAREAIGLAIAAERSQGELHRNGLQSSGVFTTDQKVGEESFRQLQKWLNSQAGGGNKHKPLVLDSGMTWSPMSMTGVDAQHIETRKLQIGQICTAFGVFPQMIGFAGDQAPTFASAEAFFTAHVTHTLAPWTERIEQSIDNDLLNDGMEYYANFDMKGMLRGNHADRASFYSSALGSGGSPAWMTQDEVRMEEGLNPLGGSASRLAVTTNAPQATTTQDGQ